MRIIHVLNSNSYSGAENVVITIINKMKKNNDIVYVSPEGPIRQYLEKNNINYEPIKKISVSEMKRVINKYEPDIIHAHDFTASIISSIVGKKRKVISHIHCNPTWMKNINLYSIVYLISTIRYKKILLVSKSIINEYIFGKFIRKKSLIIDNPIDIKKIILQADENVIKKQYDLIFIGRLAEAKNPLEFIELVNELKKEINIKAVMIGDGILRNECVEKIKNLNLENVIEMKGFLENPYIILKKSKILCMTSKWEGYGLVAVEAMALGKPVVSKKSGGIESIVNEKCGKIVDNKEDMLNEVKRLLIDSKYYEIKHTEAFKRAEEIDNIDIYIGKIDKIYQEI